jgi:hypothetical protein
VPEREAYQYALWRVVPHVERGEAINVGVVLFCRRQSFLGALTHVDEERLRALSVDLDLRAVRTHLAARCAVAAGDPSGGAVAALDLSDRFGWLVAPSSTVIQPSQVHTGLSEDSAATLDHLFNTLVLSPAGS